MNNSLAEKSLHLYQQGYYSSLCDHRELQLPTRLLVKKTMIIVGLYLEGHKTSKQCNGCLKWWH